MNGPIDFDLDLAQLADIERYVAGAPDPEPVDPEGIRPFSYPIGDGKAAEGLAPGFQATALASLDLDLIPPRRWLYGRELLRGFVSVLGSPGGVGKTAFTMVVGLSVATGRSLLATEPLSPGIFQRVQKTGAVWFYNLEDPEDEMRRRIKAAIMHHKVDYGAIKDTVYVDSGRDRPLVIASRDASGNLVATPIVDELVDELLRRKIALLVVDPFVQSHSAEENRNDEMNLVMALWGQVAHRAECAVWLVHHFRKGGQAGDSEAFRGAGAIQGAARVMSTLSAMSKDEAAKLNIPDDKRRSFVRLDNAKANMGPPAEAAEWYQLVGINIGNATEEYPDGDSVQSVEAWAPPTTWGDLPYPLIVRILEQIERGPADGERYALGKQAKARWAGNVIMEMADKSEFQALSILKSWKDNGVIVEGEYRSAALQRRKTGCITVSVMKLAEMRQAAANYPSEDDESGR
ncbi:AAA family ATPase [Gluconacetobacter diazotrophicus]|uniref:AAA family ATPase n=1 Tax=Gluconacetobacter diazotrophicus TaxID=33996 RepID=A0A7W4I699_GLUDI|nr:helicase RepA family protein [Gluconacetobacter diazotrophicus]MBB2157043.1 AAA family ATPase [Gluconacetobacter diazotrophicus]